jgi:hypothetical protein
MFLVRTDVSEECTASILRVKIISELGALAVTSNYSTLRRITQLMINSSQRAIVASY